MSSNVLLQWARTEAFPRCSRTRGPVSPEDRASLVRDTRGVAFVGQCANLRRRQSDLRDKLDQLNQMEASPGIEPRYTDLQSAA